MVERSLVSYSDGLTITYSGLITDQPSGDGYITLYCRKAGKDGVEKYAEYRYPGDSFMDIKGFSEAEITFLKEQMDRTAYLAFEVAKADAELSR